MRALAVAAALALATLTLAAACADTEAPANNGASDEDYLAALCSAFDEYSRALAAATDAAGIETVTAAFAVSMKAVTPPNDLATFQADLIAYIEAGAADPQSVVAAAEPRPPDKARDRLAAKEGDVKECREASYFGQR